MPFDLQLGAVDEATRKLAAKQPVASILKSADWAKLPVELRDRGLWSSTLEDVRVLQTFREKMLKAVSGAREQLANGKSAFVDRSSFIGDLRKLALESGLGSATNQDDLTNLAGRARLGLIYDMQDRGAFGFARWKNDQDTDALASFPAWEFKRIYARRLPRLDWAERWDEAFAGDEGATESSSGRMIALKTSPGWEMLSVFGTPWAPFDYGSGMGLRDVSRKTALAIGILDEDEVLESREAGFNDKLQAEIKNLQPEFVAALQTLFGDQIEIGNGIARWVAGKLAGAAANSTKAVNSAFNSDLHPHQPAGSREGGQFISKDWQTLGLPSAKDLPAVETLPRRGDRAKSLASLDEGFVRDDPVGRHVKFAQLAKSHVSGADNGTRPEFLPLAVKTVDHPVEIWEYKHRHFYIGVLQRDGGGTSGAMVVAARIGEHENEVISFSPKHVRDLNSLRKGTLLYKNYGR